MLNQKYKKKEIGSEYQYENHKEEVSLNTKKSNNYILTFSGRTSIETVLKNEFQIKKALLPSYCCDSMIEPFRQARIIVDFYDVYYENGIKINVSIDNDIDAILWCNYFGFDVSMPDMKEFINRGGVIIEDITHSLLSNQVYHKQSSYLIGSIRKWGPVLSGGICVALDKTLKEKPQECPSREFVDKKKKAMTLKQKYLSGEQEICKDQFLNMFSESNKWLADNYSNLKIDEESLEILKSINWKDVCQRRCDNATILYGGLEKCKNIKPLFNIIEMNSPLFLPIIVDKENRQSLRKYLTENKIYCPIHWPKPNDKCESNLYDIELSLICDQRYDKDDIKRMVDVIKKWDKDITDTKRER
ncbi:hypothetical protein [Faecalimonas sp.]